MRDKVFIPWIYDSESSFTETLEQCCDRNRELSPELLANLIAKYVFSYVYPSEINTKIPEEDLNNFFYWALRYHKNYHWERRTDVGDFAKVYAPFHYQLWMAGDIAPTIILLQAIISEQVREVMSDSVINIEAGTGSGILQIWRYIWAQRNGINMSVQNNIWIEASPEPAFRSHEILTKLQVGRVLCENSTDIGFYKRNNIPKEVWFFTNENIPRHGVSIEREPFIPNLFTLLEYIWEENFSHMRMFPYTALFQHIVANESILLWGKNALKNLLYLKLISKRKEDFESHLLSTWIGISEEVFFPDQWTIWDEYLVWGSEKGFLYKKDRWYHRWKKWKGILGNPIK